MKRLIESRRMVLDMNGRKVRVPVGNDMTEDKMNRILLIGRAYLQQYAYVEMVMMECFMQKIEQSLQKKKCFRFMVKRLWNECKTGLKKTISHYDVFAPSSEFNNEYAMTYYEKISDDLYKLRDKLALRFKNLGYSGKSGLYANAVVLYNLALMGVNIYEAIMIRLRERLGVGMMDAYLDYCPVDAYNKSHDFLVAVMGNDFEAVMNHIATKEIVAYFEKVRDGIFDSKTMDEAARNATDDMDEEEKATQRKYVDVSDVMSSDFPIDSVKRKVS